VPSLVALTLMRMSGFPADSGGAPLTVPMIENKAAHRVMALMAEKVAAPTPGVKARSGRVEQEFDGL
jgi:hypothetical protein